MSLLPLVHAQLICTCIESCRHPHTSVALLCSAMYNFSRICRTCTVVHCRSHGATEVLALPPRSYAVTAVLCVLLAAFSSPSLIGTLVSLLALPESCCKLTSLPQPCSRSVHCLLLHQLASDIRLGADVLQSKSHMQGLES